MFNKIKEFFFPKIFPKKPLILKKKDEINLKGLEKKTKAELEKLGRKIGIELDKRLTKDKLIKQIKKATK
jgi:nitrogenase molybdenum-iron protein alpha/beta subunit